MTQEDCWIHLTNISGFLYLGNHPHEKKIGQNVTIDLSLRFPYTATEDRIDRTVDYGLVCERLQQTLAGFKQVNLLEYLAEQILCDLGNRFPKLKAARISIQKGYVPLAHFTGRVKIEAEKQYR